MFFVSYSLRKISFSLRLFFFCSAFLILSSCTDKFTPPIMENEFDESNLPPSSDYSKPGSWAALPDKKDFADLVPGNGTLKDEQSTAKADVFFIHPTSYLRKTQLSTGWNADITDEIINQKTDEGAIKNQATIFNGSCRVYAPRYRQAFISAYFVKDKLKREKALQVAYKDVKNAFEYYLQHYNNGRPIIVASHSQGTTHAVKLMKDFFDGTDLQKQLIAAYLIGMDVYDTLYSTLKPCNNADETGCYMSWRTYAVNYFPPGYVPPNRYAVNTNPLNWKTDSTYADYRLNKGGVLKKFSVIVPGVSDAQIADGVLRINKPKFKGSFLFHFNNYHIVDYNLFYINIRENVNNRVNFFLESNKHTP